MSARFASSPRPARFRLAPTFLTFGSPPFAVLRLSGDLGAMRPDKKQDCMNAIHRARFFCVHAIYFITTCDYLLNCETV